MPADVGVYSIDLGLRVEGCGAVKVRVGGLGFCIKGVYRESTKFWDMTPTIEAQGGGTGTQTEILALLEVFISVVCRSSISVNGLGLGLGFRLGLREVSSLGLRLEGSGFGAESCVLSGELAGSY